MYCTLAMPNFSSLTRIGYLPFVCDQANLFFQVVAKCYEKGSRQSKDDFNNATKPLAMNLHEIIRAARSFRRIAHILVPGLALGAEPGGEGAPGGAAVPGGAAFTVIVVS
jgi:hypothetical protein